MNQNDNDIEATASLGGTGNWVDADGDGDIGDAYEFTASDLADASTYTNVGLGEMNSGLFVDFDRTALDALVHEADETITFTVGTSDTYVAQLQDAGGTAIGSSITLTGGTETTTINLGEGVVFEYADNGSELDGGVDLKNDATAEFPSKTSRKALLFGRS